MGAKMPPSPEAYKYTSYIEDRSPKYKVHRNIGQAKNAVLYQVHGWPRGGVIFEFIDGEWKEIFSYEPDFSCVLCGGDVRQRPGIAVGYSWPTIYNKDDKREDAVLAHYSCMKDEEK